MLSNAEIAKLIYEENDEFDETLGGYCTTYNLNKKKYCDKCGGSLIETTATTKKEKNKTGGAADTKTKTTADKSLSTGYISADSDDEDAAANKLSQLSDKLPDIPNIF